MKKAFLPLLAIGGLFLACNDGNQQSEKTKSSDSSATVNNAADPSSLTVTKLNLYPEGITYDKNRGKFIVTSIKGPEMYVVNGDSTLSLLGKAPTGVISFGLKADAARNQLYVASLAGPHSYLGMYNLSTGQLIRQVDLTAIPGLPGTAHLPNDVVYDNEGNVYVTDSYAPVVYKVTQSGAASVLISDPALQAPSGKTGLNGIAYVPDGNCLLVAKSDDGKLFKITLGATPALSLSYTATPAKKYGFDGLLMLPDGRLAGVSNTTPPDNWLVMFNTTNNWQNATVTGTPLKLKNETPTTLTLRNNKLYVSNARLTTAASGTDSLFTIEQLPY